MNKYLEYSSGGTNSRTTTFEKFIGIFSFGVLFPYPALPVGNNTGLQFGHVVTIAALWLMAKRVLVMRDLLACYLLLVVPSLLPLILGRQSDVNVNATATQSVALLTFVAAGVAVSRKGAIRNLCVGAALATLVHGVVGIIQQIFYLNEAFPFLQLYVNPSFAEMETGKITDLYAVYSKRSFGLFPEPSSMFAVLAPWVIIIFNIVFVRTVQLGRIENIIYILSLIFGGLLIYFAKSGGMPYLALGMLPSLALFYKKTLRRPLLQKIVVSLISVLILGFAVYAFLWSFQERAYAELDHGVSWTERLTSILFALQSVFKGDLMPFFFGYGLGDVSTLALAATGSSGIHSWVIATFMGTGMVGAIGMILVGLKAIRSIRSSSQRMLGYSVFFVWAACAALITGYAQLLGMWAVLGMLLKWDAAFPVQSKSLI
jgi:hypothetical protein